MNIRKCFAGIVAIAALAAFGPTAQAEVTVVVGHNDNDAASGDFKFQKVPPPSKMGLAGTYTVVDGETDGNSGGTEKLNDGALPTEADAPADSFFFAAGTSEGRLRLDLKGAKTIREIDSYSWHPNTRGPQVYKLYGANGEAAGFNASPKNGADPATCGWTLIASVDTRPKEGEPGGQYGVNIRDPYEAIGKYRYLLFDCQATETDDSFGQTFFSEINVRGTGETAIGGAAGATAAVQRFVAKTPDGKYEITIDTTRAPDLTDWAKNDLAPVLVTWYPKIVAMLPSEGYEAPTHFNITIKPGRGVADTEGTHVNGYAEWLRREKNGEAVGSLIHECVHVVQQYGSARHHAEHPTENPGYFVEGMADYVRWFLYEPQSKGAEIGRRGLSRANYDGSYRTTANFLNWVTLKYDKEIVPKLNAAMREGRYSDELWVKNTGKTVEQLNTEWKADLRKKLNPGGNAPS